MVYVDAQRGQRVTGVGAGLDTGLLANGEVPGDIGDAAGDEPIAGGGDRPGDAVPAGPGQAEAAGLGRIRASW